MDNFRIRKMLKMKKPFLEVEIIDFFEQVSKDVEVSIFSEDAWNLLLRMKLESPEFERNRDTLLHELLSRCEGHPNGSILLDIMTLLAESYVKLPIDPAPSGQLFTIEMLRYRATLLKIMGEGRPESDQYRVWFKLAPLLESYTCIITFVTLAELLMTLMVTLGHLNEPAEPMQRIEHNVEQ